MGRFPRIPFGDEEAVYAPTGPCEEEAVGRPSAEAVARVFYDEGRRLAVYHNRAGPREIFDLLDEPTRRYYVAVAQELLGQWDDLIRKEQQDG